MDARTPAPAPKGHGHVTPNPDGSKARCGGPSICPECRRELAALRMKQSARPDPPDPYPAMTEVPDRSDWDG